METRLQRPMPRKNQRIKVNDIVRYVQYELFDKSLENKTGRVMLVLLDDADIKKDHTNVVVLFDDGPVVVPTHCLDKITNDLN